MIVPCAMHIEVTSDVVDTMHCAAGEEYPREACGILLGQGNLISAFIKARNVHATPETRFEIDPQALIDAHRSAREGGPQVVGYFHSHPSGKARPSKIDRQSSSGDGRIWAIWGDGEVHFWRDGESGFESLTHAIVAEKSC